MVNHSHMRSMAAVLVSVVLISVAALLTATPARAGETTDYCLSCHGNPDLQMVLPSGESLPLYISAEALAVSVHNQVGIECNACHTEIQTYPHPDLDYQNKRELARALYQSCQKCHSDNYDKALDSMHAQVALAGNLDAPICTDCHGAHDVQDPDEPRAHVSTICGQCHTTIYEEYHASVHGDALIEQSNPDVPVCTDCHGVHNIQDPRTELFRVQSPDLCAGCHADPELMAKYNLPSNVYELYELSWHGVDVSVYKARWPTIWHDSAVCTDCHGIHNIRKTEDADSLVNEQNLLQTCQKCHPDASPNWTEAWTGHHEVSLQRTPFIFYTQAFYASFAPFVLGLSLIYVILQIIRSTVERARRGLR